MTQPAVPQSANQIDPVSVRLGEPTRNEIPKEFNYRPVPVLAPVSLFLGICSFLSVLTLLGVGIAMFGTVLGAVCLWRIRQSAGELSGKSLALIGFLLSLLFLVSGSSLHAYTIATEVPEGFRRVNFYHDVSKKGFVYATGVSDFHPDVKALDDEKIFIKGYMYPTRQTQNLTSFLLVKDNEKCCFGGQPSLTDMILVEMQDGKTVDFSPGLVSVAGIFHTQRAAEGPADLSPVYAINGIFCEPARTAF